MPYYTAFSTPALLSAHLCQHQHLYVDIISYPVAYYMLAGHYWTMKQSAASSQLGQPDLPHIPYCSFHFIIIILRFWLWDIMVKSSAM